MPFPGGWAVRTTPLFSYLADVPASNTPTTWLLIV